MFGPNYDFCEQTWFGSSEKISEYQIQSTDRGSEALNLVVCDNGAYPQYELLPLEFKHKKMPETGYLDPYKKKKKRKKHSVKKQLLQDEAILSGLQTVIDLCGLLDRCELKTGQDKIVCTPTNSKKVDAEIDCKVADSKSRSSCESKSHKSVCIKVNKLSPYHAVLAHVSENSRKQQTEQISPAKKHKSNIPKLINRPAASSKQSAINYSVGVDSYTPYFQEVTVNPCAACGKKDSKDSVGSKGSKDKVSKRNSDKDVKSKNSKNSKKSSGSNLSISCIPPVQVPACGSTSCTECKKFEKMLQKYEKKNKSCECRILRSRNNGAKSECLGENQTKLFVPERSCSEQQGVILKRKNLNCKHSRNSIPLVQPVLGTCNEVLAVAAQEDLYFSKHPEDQDVVFGKFVTLQCATTPSEGIAYYWELNGSKISNTTRRHQRGSNLHITRVDRERDSGQFRCNAQDPSGISITSSPASLNIQWIEEPSVQIQSPESASYITAGGEVILRCHLEASGDIHVEWFRNAERLVKSSRVEMKKRRLHLKSVAPSDNGIYKCTAQNEAGSKHSTRNFALAVAGNQTALIEKVPSNQLVKKGGTAIFECSYTDADVIEWYFKDVGPLETNNRITIYSNGTLHINDVESSDQGLYNCVGVKSESSEVPQSYTAELHLAYIHKFTPASFEPHLAEDDTYIVAEGSEFQLTCLEPKSSPEAKKWWINNEGHTISDSGQVKVDDDGRLIIEKLQPNNAGNYTCVAENIAGSVDKTITLIVTTKPIIVKQPVSITVEENDNAVLTCEFESQSEMYTNVKWKKDGKPIRIHDLDDGSTNPQRIKVFKHNGTLLIHSSKTSDRGEYVCEVITAGFKPVVSKTATISVVEILKFAPPPVSKKLELGTVAKIHCKAQGTPPPIIRWEKVGGGPDNFPNHITDMNGTLHFNGVLADDKGKYTCTASNSQGIVNATVVIDVVVSPKFSLLPKNPTEVIEGSSVLLNCVVEGDPKPTIQWDKNSKMNDFDHSRFIVLENGTLFINEVHKEDENHYGCTGGSSAGLNRKEVRLIVHGRDHQLENSNEGSAVTKAVLITMSVAAAYIILVVGLMIWCRYRRKSRKLPVTDAKTENGDVEHTELKEGTNGHLPGTSKTSDETETKHKDGQKSDGAETTHSQSSNQSKKSKNTYDKLALSRTHLKETKLIGRGEFGDILIAKISQVVTMDKRNSTNMQNGISEDKDVHVLVKALSQTKDENSLTEFKREIDMFSKLTNDNVTRLLGLCREAEPHYMILEHTDWGDLKQFLTATKKGDPPPLTSVQCVAISLQLAKGMEQLSSTRMIHKDLAARNCVITSKLVAKIGMSRMTRDPYSMEYCKHVNQIIPLRWMPYEAVYEDEFSTKSDVYSFGVVVWEIFQQGELPFPKMNDNSFLTKLKEKSLEWKYHKDTPEALQKLQETCLDTNPMNRPTFSSLVKDIEEVLKSP